MTKHKEFSKETTKYMVSPL